MAQRHRHRHGGSRAERQEEKPREAHPAETQKEARPNLIELLLPGSVGSHGPREEVAFDFGVGLALLLVFVLLPAPARAVRLLSCAGIAVICVVVQAAMPFAMIRLHGRAAASHAAPSYRRAVSFAIRLVGMVAGLGMWFLVPYSLRHQGIVPAQFDSLLFVIGMLATMAGVLAALGNAGPALAIMAGSALIGIFFGLIADIGTWTARPPANRLAALVSALVLAVVFLAALGFVAYTTRHVEDVSGMLERWIARPRVQRIVRLLVPFLLAFALSWWNMLYTGLFAGSLRPAYALLAITLLGVVPYRILLILTPPIRPIPVLTGLLALGACVATVFR